jgi:hypothetical protein
MDVFIVPLRLEIQTVSYPLFSNHHQRFRRCERVLWTHLLSRLPSCFTLQDGQQNTSFPYAVPVRNNMTWDRRLLRAHRLLPLNNFPLIASKLPCNFLLAEKQRS